MNRGTHRDVHQFHGITRFDVQTAFSCSDRITDNHTLRLKNITLVTICIVNKSDTTVTVWIVFDRGYCTGNTKLITLEVNNTVKFFCAGFFMTRSDTAIIITSCVSSQFCQQ
jgi:hypothetical protein